MNNILFYGTYVTSIIPLLVYILFYKQNRILPIRVIAFYQLYSFLNDILITFLNDQNKPANNRVVSILSSAFTSIEFLFFGLFFLLILIKKSSKRAIYIGGVIFLTISLIDLFLKIFKNQSSFNTIPISVSAITLIIFSIFYFYEQIQNPDVSFIYSKPYFWIVVGIMLYFSGTFFLFLQFSELSTEEQYNYWIINWICIILKNIFFSIAFYLPKDYKDNFLETKSDLSFYKELD